MKTEKKKKKKKNNNNNNSNKEEEVHSDEHTNISKKIETKHDEMK